MQNIRKTNYVTDIIDIFFLNGYYHFRDQAHTGKQQKK